MKRVHPLVWPLVALTALLVFNAALTPGFFAITVRDGRLFGSLIDVLNRSAPVMLLAIGMTLVIATGGVDLSVGAVMAVAGAVAACLIARPADSPLSAIDVGGSFPLVIALALGSAVLAGLFNGVLVARGGVQPIVATLILMVAGRGVAQLLTNGQIVTFTDPRLASIGTGMLVGLPVPIWLALGFAATVYVLTRRTALGLFIEAVGSSAPAARLAGIDAAGIKTAVYVICALGAGVAGLVACADIKGADANNAGLYLELDAILAVCVGGTRMTGGKFTLAGTLLGAVLMQTLTTTILTRGVSPHATLVAKALIIVAVCLMQSPEFRRAARLERAVGT